jgi:protein ImuB
LNQARPIHVEADESGEPQAVVLGRERLAVAAVQDRWRIDDEWWRERPVSRMYFRVLLEDGRVATVYYDFIGYRWYQQKYN